MLPIIAIGFQAFNSIVEVLNFIFRLALYLVRERPWHRRFALAFPQLPQRLIGSPIRSAQLCLQFLFRHQFFEMLKHGHFFFISKTPLANAQRADQGRGTRSTTTSRGSIENHAPLKGLNGGKGPLAISMPGWRFVGNSVRDVIPSRVCDRRKQA